MAEPKTQSLSEALVFSIVLCAYNDWAPLNSCLRTLAEQENPPRYEVIVVDDGSSEPAPESIHEWSRHFLLTIIREQRTGISSARNRGIKQAVAPVVLFVDADCELRRDCLSKFAAAISAMPKKDYFQLHLVGDCSRTIGRAEELRLRTLLHFLVRPEDGRIRYLNTAGFAVRKSAIGASRPLFEPGLFRAEDTLLLSQLIQENKLPVFVPEAVIVHFVRLSFAECLRKDFQSARLESMTYRAIADRGVTVRVGFKQRMKMLWFMWKESGQRSIGRFAWFAAFGRQLTQRAFSLLLH
jgi:glycosyltransferase involved in cell wall biosynthesis